MKTGKGARSMDIARRIELLRASRFLSDAPEEVLESLAGECTEVRLDAGEILFEEGAPGDALFVVHEGELEIYIGDTPLDTSEPGQCVGEMALVTSEPRSASIRSRGPSRLLRVPRAAFRRVLEEHPSVALGVIEELAEKVRRSIRARVERHRITVRLEEALARSVSQSVMDKLFEGHDLEDRLRSESRRVTALYVDFHGLPALCERIPPGQLFEIVNTLLSSVVENVLEHGGTLDRYTGGGVLAWFGAPLSEPDDARRAVSCAQAIIDRFTIIREEDLPANSRSIRIGAALTTGQVFTGVVGDATRARYTAVGNVVTLVQGVQRLTRTYGADLLLCDETARRLGPGFVLREVDRVRLRGRIRPTHVYDMLCTLEDASPEKLQLLSDYRHAYAVYASGRFQSAAEHFADFLQVWPDDGPARTLHARAQGLAAEPPEHWDGVFHPDSVP